MRRQSAMRVWRSNYINFILEHSKNTHSVVAWAEFGAPGCDRSPPHDGDSILSYRQAHATQHPSMTK